MSSLKRIVVSLFAKVDQVVSEIENHDALIKAAIQEQRKKIAAAKVEFARVKKHEENVQEKIQQLETNIELWAKRAVREASASEENALACMQQREATLQQANKLKSILQKYADTSRRMKQDIQRGENELSELTQKHQIMRARQSTAEALNKTGGIAGTSFEDLESSFDRWEVKISQGEYMLDSTSIDTEMDDLEQLYVKAEQKQNLKAQLDELLKGEQSNG